MPDRTQILFLDIDGVLNSEASFRYWSHTLQQAPVSSKLWCPICTHNLRVLFEQAPSTVKVVLASTWRLCCDTLEDVKAIFEERSVDSSRVIGATPHFPGHPRGHEINAWLLDFGPKYDISSWAILDDDRDMAQHLPQLVKTDFRVGLTLPDVDKALKLMRRVLVEPGWYGPAERQNDEKKQTQQV